MKNFIENVGDVLAMAFACLGGLVAMAIALVSLIFKYISEGLCIAGSWIVSKLNGMLGNRSQKKDDNVTVDDVL